MNGFRLNAVSRAGVVLALLLSAAACGSDDDSAIETTAPAEAAEATETAEATDTAEAPETAEATETAEAPETTAASDEIPQGGTLRVGNTQEAAFDPDTLLVPTNAYGKLLYDSLIEFDADRNPIPWLATEWEMAADNLSITLTLRDDVVYHSGTPMTAESIIPTIEKKKDPATGFLLSGVLVPIVGFEALDEHTLKLSFDQPLREGHVMDLMELIRPYDPAAITTLDTAPSGTGPFMFESTEAGRETVLVKNPNYWRSGEPVLDEVVFVKFSDSDSASAALEAGEVDMTWPATTGDAARLNGNGYTVEPQPVTTMLSVRMNVDRPPFDNKTFRQAMQYAIDRETAADSIYEGFADPYALPWAVPPGSDPAVLEEYAFDLDRAQELVEESGVGDPSFTVQVLSYSPEQVLIAQMIQANLAEIGVNMDIEPLDLATFVENINSTNFDMLVVPTSHASRFPTIMSTIGVMRADEQNSIWGANVPAAYVDAMTRAYDPAEDLESALDDVRAALLDESWQVFISDSPIYIPVTSDAVGYETIQDPNGFLVLRDAHKDS